MNGYDAFICFIDIIDSVSYSKIMDSKEYVNKITAFETEANVLFDLFFDAYKANGVEIATFVRGDEFLFIIVDNNENWSKNEKILIFENLLFFILILKKILREHYNIEIACGIHIDKVYTKSNIPTANLDFTESKCGISARYYGRSINYGKRVESSSRKGIYSQIVFSRYLKDVLCSLPILVHEIVVEMKGFCENEIVYEYKDGLVLSRLDNNKDLLAYLLTKKYIFYFIKDYYNYSFIYFLLNNGGDNYVDKDKFLSCIWEPFLTNNPIVLYLRGRLKSNEKNYSAALRYYMLTAQSFPMFMALRKEIINLLNFILEECKTEYIDIITVVEMKILAQDFIEHYKDLKNDEKSQFESFIKNAEEYIKKRIG